MAGAGGMAQRRRRKQNAPRKRPSREKKTPLTQNCLTRACSAFRAASRCPSCRQKVAENRRANDVLRMY